MPYIIVDSVTTTTILPVIPLTPSSAVTYINDNFLQYPGYLTFNGYAGMPQNIIVGQGYSNDDPITIHMDITPEFNDYTPTERASELDIAMLFKNLVEAKTINITILAED